MILWNRTVAACQVSVPDKDGLITGAPWSGELELPSPTPAVGGARALLELSWIRVTEALNLRRSSVRSECSVVASCMRVPIQKPMRWAGRRASRGAKPALAWWGLGVLHRWCGGDPEAAPVSPPRKAEGPVPGQELLCQRARPPRPHIRR